MKIIIIIFIESVEKNNYFRKIFDRFFLGKFWSNLYKHEKIEV